MTKEKEKKILTKMQYEIGEITRRNDDLGFAKMFYREAAEKGDASAQNNLGVTYEKAGDYDKALFWYKQAYDGGNRRAIVNLGIMYEFGRGTKEDFAEAAKYYRRAIELKMDEGYYRLGKLYFEGKIDKEDKLKALHIWLDGVFHAEDEAEICSFKAGYSYEYGLGIPQDYSKALWLYKKSASFGSPVANFNVGQIYLYGHGVEKDLEKAIRYYLNAAKRGYSDAMYALAFIFYDKENIKRNNDVAMFWFTYAAEKGNLHAMLASGEFWLTGEICAINKKAAFNILMEFLTTVESDDEEHIDAFKQLKERVDDDDFWKQLDYSYSDYCEKHNLHKIGEDHKAEA